MLDLIKEYIIKFTDFVCGWPLFTLLIGGGIFLFIYSRALPLRKLGMIFVIITISTTIMTTISTQG